MTLTTSPRYADSEAPGAFRPFDFFLRFIKTYFPDSPAYSQSPYLLYRNSRRYHPSITGRHPYKRRLADSPLTFLWPDIERISSMFPPPSYSARPEQLGVRQPETEMHGWLYGRSFHQQYRLNSGIIRLKGPSGYLYDSLIPTFSLMSANCDRQIRDSPLTAPTKNRRSNKKHVEYRGATVIPMSLPYTSLLRSSHSFGGRRD